MRKHQSNNLYILCFIPMNLMAMGSGRLHTHDNEMICYNSEILYLLVFSSPSSWNQINEAIECAICVNGIRMYILYTCIVSSVVQFKIKYAQKTMNAQNIEEKKREVCNAKSN